MINLRQFFRSLRHAFRGMYVVFRGEQSFRLQTIVALIVVLFAFYVKVSILEWIVLLLLIGSVLSLELINSIFERIVDTFKPRIHPIVRDIKDIMAATVLVASLLALAVGVIIFLPYLLTLVGG